MTSLKEIALRHKNDFFVFRAVAITEGYTEKEIKDLRLFSENDVRFLKQFQSEIS